MAISQLSFEFVPRIAIINRYGMIPTQLYLNQEERKKHFENKTFDDDFDFEDAFTINWWLETDITINMMLPLFEKLGTVQSWTKDADDFLKFGEPSSNDLSVFFNSVTKRIEAIGCRLDLVLQEEFFIEGILSIATQFDFLLMDNQARLFEPTIAELYTHMQLSDAHRFMSNPTQFFDDLSKGVIEP